MFSPVVYQPQRSAEPLAPVPATDKQLEALWIICLAELSDSSKRTYRARLAGFTAWLGVDADTLPLLLLQSDVASFHVHVHGYRDFLKSSSLAAATRNLTLAALCRVIQRLYAAQLLSWTLTVRGFKARKYRDTAGPTVEVVKELLAASQTDAHSVARRTRDEAIIRLALSLGLRRSEIVQLNLSDVAASEHAALHIAIREKGATDKRSLLVPSSAARALSNWIVARATFENPGSEGEAPLFIRLTRAAVKHRVALRLTDDGVAYILEDLRASRGISGRIRPHGLRHRAITSLLESGASLTDAVAFARHSDPKTTMIYWDNAQQAGAKAAAVVDALFDEDCPR